MGQHKFNERAKLAREGKLPPKPKKMGDREYERWLVAALTSEYVHKVFGFMNRH